MKISEAELKREIKRAMQDIRKDKKDIHPKYLTYNLFPNETYLGLQVVYSTDTGYGYYNIAM